MIMTIYNFFLLTPPTSLSLISSNMHLGKRTRCSVSRGLGSRVGWSHQIELAIPDAPWDANANMYIGGSINIPQISPNGWFLIEYLISLHHISTNMWVISWGSMLIHVTGALMCMGMSPVQSLRCESTLLCFTPIKFGGLKQHGPKLGI